MGVRGAASDLLIMDKNSLPVFSCRLIAGVEKFLRFQCRLEVGLRGDLFFQAVQECGNYGDVGAQETPQLSFVF